jgi:hypothetical protein
MQGSATGAGDFISKVGHRLAGSLSSARTFSLEMERLSGRRPNSRSAGAVLIHRNPPPAT